MSVELAQFAASEQLKAMNHLAAVFDFPRAEECQRLKLITKLQRRRIRFMFLNGKNRILTLAIVVAFPKIKLVFCHSLLCAENKRIGRDGLPCLEKIKGKFTGQAMVARNDENGRPFLRQ